MRRQIHSEREQQHQKNDKQRRGQNPLRILAETINPVHVLLRIAHQITEWQDHQRDNCLPDKSALIVAEPVKCPEKQQREDNVET